MLKRFDKGTQLFKIGTKMLFFFKIQILLF